MGVAQFSVGSSRLGIAAASGLLVVSLFAAGPVWAQMDQLKGALGSGQSGGAMGGLTGGIPSVTQASPGNIAGVLQYCVRNNYLSGGSATSVKDSLVGKMSGSGQPTHDPSFQSGNNGMLQTGNGQSFSLGGSGIKEQVTHKVCDQVLQHAKSLL
jgi:Protein of unknown function (DUF2501)